LGGSSPHLIALIGPEPRRVLRPVGQPDEGGDAQQHGGRCLEQEDPLPAAQPQDAVHVEDGARDRRAYEAGHRDRHHEDADDGGAVARRIPIGEIEDHAGEEAGFGNAQQEAQHQERGRPADQGEGRRDEAPADHDARDPGARAEALQGEVARHLEDEIADEEDAGAQAVGLGIEADRLVHLQGREAHVHAVDIGDQVGGQQEGHQAPRHATHRGRLELLLGAKGGHVVVSSGFIAGSVTSGSKRP